MIDLTKDLTCHVCGDSGTWHSSHERTLKALHGRTVRVRRAKYYCGYCHKFRTTATEEYPLKCRFTGSVRDKVWFLYGKWGNQQMVGRMMRGWYKVHIPSSTISDWISQMRLEKGEK